MRESSKQAWRGFGRDLRYAVRGLGRSPGFTAVAVLTLALGIGANSAIFSVVNGVLLEPLPYGSPDRLVFIHTQFPSLDFDKFWVSPPELRGLQERVESFSAIGGWRAGAVNVAGADEPVRVPSATATAELFEALGVAPARGRPFLPDEDVEGAAPVVVISHGLWQRVFGGSEDVVGSTLDVDGEPATVVGVMPPGFDIQDSGVDVWVPARLPANPENWGSHWLNLVGRLAPGVTLEQARSEVAALLQRWPEEAQSHRPNAETHPVVVKPLADEAVGGVRSTLYLLLGAVGLVLLIACANVANLLLARSESRQREVAVRVAMGAGRGRLVAQFMTESLTLALAGGILGLGLGYAGLRLMLAAAPESLPRLSEIGLSGDVLAFTLGITILTGLLFGLAPLLHLSQRAMSSALKEGGRRTTATGSRQRLRRLLVVAEVGLAVVLVVGSGLLLRSLGELQKVDPGFRTERLLTFQLYLPSSRYEDGTATAGFYRTLIERLETTPGVEAAAAMSGLPPLRNVNANDTAIEGYEPGPDDPAENVDYYQVVSGDYFETMEIPMASGRAFREGDAGGPAVAVVNERLAAVFFGETDPIGRRIKPSWVDPWFTIVGVARDVKQGGLSEPTGTELYLHAAQIADTLDWAQRTMNLVVRTTRDPLAMGPTVRQAVRELDPTLPIASLQTMEANLADSVVRPRFLATLLTAFAALALALAVIGTYGVMAYTVAERSHEIGIRMAMGAGRNGILAMVLKSGLATAVAGVVIGLAAAFALTRLMESLLFGVSAIDAAAFVTAPAVLLAAAAAASLVPALRATRLDPADVLRQE